MQSLRIGPKGPPRKPAVAGERVTLGLRVIAKIKERLDAAARENGRSQSEEAEVRVNWSFEFQDRMGGPQTLHLLAMLAETALLRFPNEDDWLDNYAAWDTVMQLWAVALTVRAPPALDREAMTASVRWAIDELRHEPDGDRAKQLQQILLAMSSNPQYPEEVRREAADAAVGDAPITGDEKVAVGRRLIAELETTHDPARREHLVGLIARMSRLEGIPAEAREEFARAAADPPAPVVPASWVPSPPAREDTRDREVAFHDAYWAMAKALSYDRFGTPTPTDEQIAVVAIEHRLFTALPEQTPRAALAYHHRIEAVRAASVVPSPQPPRGRTLEPVEKPARPKP